MEKNEKQDVVEKATEQPQASDKVEKIKVKKVKMKNLTPKEETYKVDLSKPSKTEDDANKKQETTNVVEEKQTETLHLDKPAVIVDPCPIHRYFRAKCHMCVAHANGINL